jgi:hypothetical protein
MKKVYILLAIIYGLHLQGMSQNNTINYQAVARQLNGTPVAGSTIKVRLTILDNNIPAYAETRSVVTNAFGLFNIQVGGNNAEAVAGSFSTLNWNTGVKTLKTEMDVNGGSNFMDMGTQPMQSVPFALQSLSTTRLLGRDISITAPTINQVLKWNGAQWYPASEAAGAFSLPYAGAQSAASTLFNVSNTGTGHAILAEANGGNAIQAYTIGNGNAITATTDKGFGVRSVINDTGIAIYGTSYRGNAAKFEVTNTSSKAPVVDIRTSGLGSGISITSKNYATGLNIDVKNNVSCITLFDTSNGNGSGSPAVYINTKSGNGVSSFTHNLGSASFYGYHMGHGEAIVGVTQSLDLIEAAAITGRNDGPYAGVRGFATVAGGMGVLGEGGKLSSNSVAGRFINTYNQNTADVLQVMTQATSVNNLAVFKKGNGNVARIDHTGKAFFNGGTQSSGADVAEAFAVTGAATGYEPGDVLIISVDEDRQVERSGTPYSSLVAGVYATKPGLLLTEEHMDTDLSDKVPMGVVGVIPTKVCNEGGAIRRGDLLVTSSVPGYAMKGDPEKIKTGQVIGKALQNFDGAEKGKINVLVCVK